MLYTQLIGVKVENEVAADLGILRDITFDPFTGEVNGLIVYNGMFRENKMFPLSFKRFNDLDRILVYGDHVETLKPPLKSNRHNYFGKDLMGKGTLTIDEEKAGSVYNFDVVTMSRPWKVWKILIRSNLRRRRLRLSFQDTKVRMKKLILKQTCQELVDEEKFCDT